MKAIRIHEPTGISGLVYEEAPDATPGLDDVLVKVAACGITHNELDWPIWTCRAGHRRLLAPRLRTSSNHSASSGLERGV
jgi:NADPH:quinone reductase-like Zn-dependent oxidoreductase